MQRNAKRAEAKSHASSDVGDSQLLHHHHRRLSRDTTNTSEALSATTLLITLSQAPDPHAAERAPLTSKTRRSNAVVDQLQLQRHFLILRFE